MPTRMIREGWLESERIDQLDANAERFFLRLLLKADDYGRYHAAPQMLKSTLFPMKEDIRSTDMTRCLAACEKAGLVRCYEVAGKQLLEIHRFDQRLRSKASKFPPPDGHMPDICPTHDGHMSARREVEEKRSRREVEEPPNPLSGGMDGKPPKNQDNIPTSPTAIRIAKLFRRKPSTPWSAKEVRAFKAIGKIDPEDLELVCRYTEAERAKGDNGRHRRDLLTFLNNYNGEIDRAREMPINGHAAKNIQFID